MFLTIQDIINSYCQTLLVVGYPCQTDIIDAKRRGNYLCRTYLTEDQARAHLYEDAKDYEENDKLRCAALHLRSQILKLPKSRTRDPATVQNMKESAPDIPQQLDFFFRTLLGGLAPTFQGAQKGAIDRKVTAMASDAIFNVTRGTVKPWKHIAMGLGLSSLTGSKLTMQILNRAGHSISYSETKGLETEFAYSVASDERDAPDGIRLLPDRATACVWDNNDANVETLDGKATLHSTVGHTYQNILQQDKDHIDNNHIQFREGRNRKTYVGSQREIPPFRKPLKMAKFVSTSPSITSESNGGTSTMMPYEKPNLQLKPFDLYWFWELRNGDTPLYAGFISKFINDPLPIQRICHMDPISTSPTDNGVVKETMIRTMNVAKETGQDYAIVTYDLAVALKAYSIQALETPLFDKLLIMLGNFHVELAFYGAVGTMINESGIEFILSEADVLAEGSMMGFIKGKFYNRCIRIHELLANVLEHKLYERFRLELPREEYQAFQDVMQHVPSDHCQAEAYLSDPLIIEHLQKYEKFFHTVMEGNIGPMSQFWAIYIFLINRLHRELQRCIKTNDVNGYVEVLPAVLDVFFSLNRPNYARWGTLFLQKLSSSNPQLLELLEKGAFSVRRTKKNYSRSAVDISLEQTVNRDAASSLKGIVPFRNSENAMRRWSLTMTQRAISVTELRTFVGLEQGETATAQCRSSRIKKDNNHMAALSTKLDEFCNPFEDQGLRSLVNLATGRAVKKATETYLLDTLKRGQVSSKKFQKEWDQDSTRFLKPVKRTRVENFASEDERKRHRKSSPAQTAQTSAESLRDMFIRMIVVLAEKTNFDLRHVLSHPITTYPLSLAHSDGAYLKTCKSALLNKLEALQTEIVTELPDNCVKVFDGGLLIHSVLSQINIGASYGSIARTILSTVSCGRANEVHVCLDKYIENSIKDSERKLRGAVDSIYVITGPDQAIRQSGSKLLNNGVFKNELGKFLLNEWGKDHYWSFFGGKTLIASYGGKCFQYVPNELKQISVTSPTHLQANHEEADTLIAFHIANITTGTVIVRASDTDVLIILIGMLGQQRPEVRSMMNIIMDCGNGNSRRYINVTNIADVLDERKPGLSRAMPGYHAFTGCDFTSAFYRKGKVKPLEIVEKDTTGRFLQLFTSMAEVDGDVDNEIASEFVCHMYGQTKVRDVDEARYIKLLQMTGKINQDNPLANIKRVDCALLPPSRKALDMKIRRTHFVTVLWNHANTTTPDQGLLPTDYGWSVKRNLLQPSWFEGPAIPDALFKRSSDNAEDNSESDGDSESDQTIIVGSQPMEGVTDELNDCDLSDGDAWSEDSDSDEDNEMDY